MKKLFILLFPLFFFGQTKEDNFISENIKSYFNLDRENIHLHLNKTVYINNETIWFKGYVLDKKTKKLHPNTTNVFITLYDANKKEIDTKLFYCSNGRIIGYFPLNKDLLSGNYYLHAFTNFMNNFKEDESSLFKIKIINPTTKDEILESESIESIEYAFEGGSFIYNTENNITVSVKNCLGEGIEVTNVKVLDDTQKVVNTFSTNQMGFGKFTLKNPKNIRYKIVAENNISSKTTELDNPKIQGINLIVNNYGIPNKTFVKIITNNDTHKEIETDKLKLIINQNEQASVVNVNLEGKPLKEFLISNESFFNGVNNLILVDKSNTILAERTFFNYKKSTNNLEINSVIRVKDSLKIKGKINKKFADLSLSVVPSNSKSNFNDANIQSSLLINNYLKNKIPYLSYYLNNYDRKKQYELDLFMSFNKYKYELKNLLGEKPSNKYEFQIGLNVSGKINQKLSDSDKEKLKLQLFSHNGIREITEIDANNEFLYKNLLIEDSLSLYYSLFKKEDKLKSLNVYSKIEGNNSKFRIPINITNFACKLKENLEISENYSNDFPKLEKIIALDTIDLTGKFTKKLDYRIEGRFGSTGFKIDDEIARSYLDILSFIQSHGFNVSQSGGSVTITTRRINGFSGSNSPIVYLDNMPLDDFSQLYRLTLNNVDEIYINKNGYGAGTYGSNGVIRIFTKKTYGSGLANDNVKSKNLIVSNGFQKLKPFKNLKYIEVTGDAFKNYGTISWIPNIYTNENGEFEVIVPHYYQDKIKVNIQGIDQDGDLHFLDTTIQVMN